MSAPARYQKVEMAEFTLPANSKIGTGKTYNAPPGAKNVAPLQASIAGTRTTGSNPVIDTYKSTSPIAGRWSWTR